MGTAAIAIALLNAGAEAGTGYDGDHSGTVIPNWTTVTGAPSVLLWANTHGFPVNSDPGPPSRGLNYFFGGAANALSVITQTLSFTGYETPIDKGAVTFALSGYLGGCPGQEDNAVVTLVWKNGGGATIGGTPQIGPVTNADRGGVNALLLRSTSGSVPVGARSVVVTLTMTRTGGSDNDGYADELVLGFTDTSLSATIDSPDAGTIAQDAQLVFEALTGGGLGTFTGKITDSGVTADLAWSAAGGFQAGYYGSTESISGGTRVYLNRTGGWRTGALTLDVSVTDTTTSTATDSRSWTAAAAVAPTTITRIEDPDQTFQPFYFLKITGLPYYFFSGIDPTDPKWGAYQWTLPAGYSAKGGMDTPATSFDQALPDLIGGIATAERITLSMQDFDETDSTGTHSFFGGLLSPGFLTSNSSAIIGTLVSDLLAGADAGDTFQVRGSGGAFGDDDTFIGGETVYVDGVSGPDGTGVYTLTIGARNKYPCNPGYPPKPSYFIPLDQGGAVIPDQTALVSQGAPFTFINRSAALYIAHRRPDGNPDPESGALCRLIGHVKAINYNNNPAKFDFVIESVISDITGAKVAPQLGHGDLGTGIHLEPEAWRTLTIFIRGIYSTVTGFPPVLNTSIQETSATLVLNNGAGNSYADMPDVARSFNDQFAAHGPVVLDFGGGVTFSYAVSMILSTGEDGKGAPQFQVTGPAAPAPSVGIVLGYKTTSSSLGLLSALGFPPGPIAMVAGDPPPLATIGQTYYATSPRATAGYFVPLASIGSGIELTFVDANNNQAGRRFFTDQGDGSGTAYCRFSDGKIAEVAAKTNTSITIKASGKHALSSPWAASGALGSDPFYYVEFGQAAFVDQIIRIPSPITGSAEKGLFQLLASKGYDNDGEFNVFPEGVGLGLDGILDKDSLRNSAFKFLSTFLVDVDATMLFTDLWTGIAKEQGLFLVWDPRTTSIALRVLGLANYVNAVAPNFTESNRASSDDRSQATTDTTNLRTGWLVRYGWDPMQKKFLAPELTLNDAYASLSYQVASRTETIEDRLIPQTQSGFIAEQVVHALFDRSVFTRYPWTSVTRTLNKTGLLVSPGQYHKIADNTLFNPFTRARGISIDDNIFGWVTRVQSTLETGKATVTFLIDQTNDQAAIRPWSPTGLLDFGAGGNGYNNVTGQCSMARWYGSGYDAGLYDGIDFVVGDKVALVTLDNDGAPAYVRAATVSGVNADGSTVVIDAGLGAVSSTRETIMVLDDWSVQTADRQVGDHRTAFQGDGDTLLIYIGARLHRWG